HATVPVAPCSRREYCAPVRCPNRTAIPLTWSTASINRWHVVRRYRAESFTASKIIVGRGHRTAGAQLHEGGRDGRLAARWLGCIGRQFVHGRAQTISAMFPLVVVDAARALDPRLQQAAVLIVIGHRAAGPQLVRDRHARL